MIFTNNRMTRSQSSHWMFLIMLSLVALPVWSAQLELKLVDAQGNALKDAVVALVNNQKPDYTELPPVVMDQRQKMFVPKVLAIRVNTQVRFPNSDDIRHHVYSFSPAKKFELRLYHGLTAEPVLFDKPGTVVLGCNIHDSMVAYIYVLETDFFAVADEQGKIQIKAPAGDYQLQIYHPQMNGIYPESAIKLEESTATTRTITVDNIAEVTTTKPADEFSNLF